MSFYVINLIPEHQRGSPGAVVGCHTPRYLITATIKRIIIGAHKNSHKNKEEHINRDPFCRFSQGKKTC